MSNKPDIRTGLGRERKLGVTAEKIDAGLVNEAEAPQPVEHDVRERKNHYQKISTAAYYQTEPRGFGGFDEAHDWPEASMEVDEAPGEDEAPGAPYSEGD